MAVKTTLSLVGGLLLIAGACLSCAQITPDTRQQIAAHAQRAQAFLQAKRPELAIPELESLLALDPENFEAHGNLGVLLFFKGRYPEAIPHLRKAVTAQPSLTKIQALLGIAERNTGDLAGARNDLEIPFPSIEDTKFKTQVGMALVELYTADADLEKAAATLRELRRIDPQNVEVLYAIYRTYSDLAGESMISMSLVAPDSAQMHQVLAHEATRKGNLAAAIAQYRQAIAIDKDLPGVHFELAEAYHFSDGEGMRQEALLEYKQALRQNPLDAKSLCRLGELYADASQNAESQAYYSRAVQLSPDDAEANFGLAKVLIATGHEDKAVPILERVVQLEPTDSAAHYRLSVLYRENGRTVDAKRELAEFQKYKQLKEKLQTIYHELQIQPERYSDEAEEKHP